MAAPSAAAGDGVAERAGEPLQHGGREEEVARGRRLTGQDLVGEVVDDEPVAARERSDEGGDLVAVGDAAQRQRGQLQPGDPALRPLVEHLRVLDRDGEAHGRGEEGVGLAGGEPEVGGTQLDELAAGAQPRQRQRRVGPGGQDDPEPLGQVLDEEGDRLVHLGLGDDVVVVEDQHTGVGVGGEVVDQAGDRVEGRRGGVGRGARLQPGPLQGGHEVGEEPGHVVVALVEREPGDTDVGVSLGEAADPLGEDGRLAEPRRRGDQPQPVSGGQELVQPVRQPLARHGLRPAGRDEELGGQHRSRHEPEHRHRATRVSSAAMSLPPDFDPMFGRPRRASRG